MVISRDYTLPAFVSDRTLVIASSYSGGTEETLIALDQALNAGATLAVGLLRLRDGTGSPAAVLAFVPDEGPYGSESNSRSS